MPGEATVRSQVLRPPYVYRWAVLLATVFAILVVLAAFVVRAFEPGPDPAHVVRAAPAKQAGPRPVPPDLIREIPTDEKVVALTFDDGPHPEYTEQVLDVLAEYDAVATFCMVGKQVRAHPGIVRDVVAAGMRLCNHSIHHDERLSRRPAAAIERELLAAGDELHAAAGDEAPVGYFRAPGGNWSVPMNDVAARHGMHPLGWSVDPRDWSRPGVPAIVASVTRAVRPGSVVLLHDGGGRRDQTVAALHQVLPWLADHGYRTGFPAKTDFRR
jgi:peptidoglycan/xylan/chitin deacetylase (PgdA/CDA1 family)